MKKQITQFGKCLIAASTISVVSYAQNVGISPTGTPPDNSAGLDVSFNNKGLLIPRVALTSATDGATIPSPATSLLVYNTGTGGLAPAGYYYNAGTPGSPNWVRLIPATGTGGAWLINGNAGTTAGTHFVGTTDAQDLVFKTNNTERMRILQSNGNVGIGTNTPQAPLQIISSVTAANADFLVNNGVKWVGLFETGNGSYNPINNPGNPMSLIFTTDNNPSVPSSGLTIAPWSSTVGGISINENGFVGIGTTTPQVRFHVENGKVTISNTYDNVYCSIEQSFSKAFHLIGSYMGWDQNAIYIGGYNGIAPTSNVAGIPISTNKVVCGGGGSPYQGIPLYAASFNTTSSRTVKTNIQKMNYGLQEILLLNPIKYEYNYDPHHIPQIGLIAEDLVEVIPEAVSVVDMEGNHLNPYQYKQGKAIAIDYSKLNVVLVNAIKEQQRTIDSLNQKIKIMEQQNQSFYAEIQKIKQHIGLGEVKK